MYQFQKKTCPKKLENGWIEIEKQISRLNKKNRNLTYILGWNQTCFLFV